MKRLKIIVKNAILSLLIGIISHLPQVYADKAPQGHEHAHTAPHGGQMLTAGKYNLEVLLQEHTIIQVYLYDAALQPLALPTPEATLYLRLAENQQHTLTLQATGSGPGAAWSATTALLREAHNFQGALRLTLDGNTKNIRFTYTVDHSGAGHSHGTKR